MKLLMSKQWKVYGLITGLLILTLFILACGDAEETPVPTATPAAPIPTPAPTPIDIAGITSEFEKIVQREVEKIQPPLSEEEIRNLIDTAIGTAAHGDPSPEVIQAMLDNAVAATAAEAVTEAEVAEAIGRAIAEAAATAPEPLTSSEIESIVKAAAAAAEAVSAEEVNEAIGRAIAEAVATAPEPLTKSEIEGIVKAAIPAPTAAPTPTATPVQTTPTPPRVPVSSRLTLAVSPPATQKMMAHLGARSVMPTLFPLYDFPINRDHVTADYTKNGLAEDWTLSSDGKKWNVNLRQGVSFHKGLGQLTVQDIITTHTVYLGPTTRAGSGPMRGTTVDDFEVVNSHEFNFTTPKPSPDLLEYWSDNRQFAVISSAYLDAVGEEAYAQSPIGTGPWKFVSLEINVGAVFERNEDHFRKVPEFSELEARYMSEDAVRLASLLAEETHIAQVVRAAHTQVRTLGLQIATASIPFVQVWTQIGGLYFPDAPTYDPDSALHDPNVRLALNLAVDKQAIIDNFLNDLSTIGSVLSIPPGHPNWDTGWAPHPYDPDRARQLITDAGAEGYSFNVTTAPSGKVPEVVDIAETYVGYWRSIGLNPTLEIAEPAEITFRGRNRGHGNSVLVNAHSATPLHVGWLPFGLSTKIGMRGSYWEFDDLDALWLEFIELAGDEERAAKIKEIGGYIFDNSLVGPIIFVPSQVAFNPGVIEGYSVNYMGHGPIVHHEYTVPIYK
jgi:peptide/nickel transport system substrate-binding protein